MLGRRHDVVAVATVTPYGTRTATLGTTLDSDFEIGSISKGVTGMLYHVALERGEVTPSTTLGEFLALGRSPVAGVTMAALAHRGGVARGGVQGPHGDVAQRRHRGLPQLDGPGP